MPPVNDDIAHAIDLVRLSGSRPFSNAGATYETGEPANDQGADGFASIWLKFTLPANGGYGYDISIDTNSTPENFDSTLELFSGGPSFGSLVLIASTDDINYPSNVRSHLTYSGLAAGTYYLRIDGWAGAGTIGPYTTDGVLAWTFTDLTPPPPAPTISSVTAANTIGFSLAGKIGTTVDIFGSNLDVVEVVSLGGVSVPFTVVSAGEITLTIPATARSGDLVVANTGGSDSRPFSVLFPGRWVQPADREIPAPFVLNGIAFDRNLDTPDAGPDEFEQVVGTGAPTYTTGIAVGQTGAVLVRFLAELLDPDTLTYGYSPRIGFLGQDLDQLDSDEDVRSEVMPAVDPTSGELSPADVFTYEWEDPIPPHHSEPGGHIVTADGYDITVVNHNDASEDDAHWGDDVENKTDDVTTPDIWTARFQARLYDPDNLTWVLGGISDVASSGAWPDDATFDGELLADHPVTDDPSELTVSGQGSIWDGSVVRTPVDNYVSLSAAETSDTTHLDDADLGPGRKLAVAITWDRLSGHATHWTAPYYDPSFYPTADQHGPHEKVISTRVSATLTWTYRPPRYRLLHTVPQIAPPQRQFPRDDGLAISTRRSWPPPTTKQYGLRRGPTGTVL